MSNFEFSPEQLKAIEEVEAGHNVFLTGGAGVGKSAVVKEIIRRYEEKGKNVAVLAPTGKAAINVGGETIHRFFQLKTAPQIADLYYEANDMDYRLAAKLNTIDLVIIDEISMVRRDVFDAISIKMLNAKFDIQLMVVGDFQQLPPVLKTSKGKDKQKSEKDLLIDHYEALKQKWFDGAFAFHASSWKDWDFKPILLTKVFRQEDELFIKCLNQIAAGDPTGKAAKWIKQNSAKEEIPNVTWICSTNKQVEEINNENLDKLKTPLVSIEAEITGENSFRKDSDCPVPSVLELKEGALVMTRINDKNDLFVNGSLGIIKEIDLKRELLKVQFNDSYVVEIPKYTWEDIHYSVKDKTLLSEKKGTFKQFPVILAYAITVHKSQGATLEKANVKPSCFEVGQLYTMLSRVKNVSGMYIEGQIQPGYCKCNKDVVKLYSMLRGKGEDNSGKVKLTIAVPREKKTDLAAVIKRFLMDEDYAERVLALVH